MDTHTDCRSKDGITVGLVDTIINSLRLLTERSKSSKDVKEALKDLAADEDLLSIVHGDIFKGKDKPQRRNFRFETILTDGIRFIRIGIPVDGKGKIKDYYDCRAYPSGSLQMIGKDTIPGLWFQERYQYAEFIPIKAKNVNPEIIKALSKKTSR